MFNNIHINRLNADGTIAKTLRVPLSYAPKQKFLARIAAQPESFEQSFATFLPRLSFEMMGLQYDPNRKVSILQQNRAVNAGSTNTLNAQYAPTPYNISMSLYLYSKNQDDGLQIIEQILPYFNPDYNLTLNAIPAMGIKNDLPIILDNITYEDEYEGDFSTRRSIIWTLNFTMKLNFYGPVTSQGIIRTTNVSTYSDAGLSNKLTEYSATVDPSTAVPGDDISIVDSFEDF